MKNAYQKNLLNLDESEGADPDEEVTWPGHF